jgi:parallel beta-helix repeat protein
MFIRVLLVAGVILAFSGFVMFITATKSCFYAGQGTSVSTAQAAITLARPGDTIILTRGTYRENLVIRKPVRIIAGGYASTVAFPGSRNSSVLENCLVLSVRTPPTGTPPVRIEAKDPERPVIEIQAEGVEIRGLTIQGGNDGIFVFGARKARLINNMITGSGQAGIALMGVRGSTLQDNVISKSEVGIRLENSHENRLARNTLRANAQGLILQNSHGNVLHENRVFANRGEGVLLTSSDRNRILKNTIERNGFGLVLLGSRENTLESNRLERNEKSLRVWGESLPHFMQEISRSNTIDGRAVVYLVGAKGATITARDAPAMIALIDSEEITIDGVTLPPQSEGILLVGTRNSRVRNSVLLKTLRGITLIDARENEIVGVRIEAAAENGITLLRSHGNKLERNVVLASGGQGLRIEDSQSVEIQGNLVEGNRESGIALYASRKVLLENNKLRNNWVGLYIEGGGSHLVQKNWIRESQFGIFLTRSSDNRFADNRLENNRHDTNVSELPPPPSPKSPPSDSSGPQAGGG